MLDRLTSIAVFARVADKGSFAAAADGLNMTPAMVGKHIRFLEDRLGTVLLSRTTRRQSLTGAGLLFLEGARTILAEVERAEGLLDQGRSIPRGVLRLTAPLSFEERLAPALVEYTSLYPEVSIDLVLSNRVADLAGEGYDAGLRVGTAGLTGLMTRPLASYRFVLCAAPSYIERFGAPAKPTDLKDHKCLTFSHWVSGDTWLFKGMDGTSVEVPIQSHMRMNSRAALRAAAIAGGGIILQSLPSLASAITDGSLKPLLSDWEPPSKQMHIVWRQERHPTRKLRTFIEFAVAQFGQDFPSAA
jgi:DNA-binding transcriptional LysR family regulator